MLPYVAAVTGFVVTAALTVFLMGELMPHSFVEWQRGSAKRLVLVGFIMLLIALAGAWLGFKLSARRSKDQMDKWKPVLALPNLDMRGAIECDHAAILSPVDPRVEKLRTDHPNLTTFLSKFRGQFGEQVWPSLLLLHTDAPPSCYTAEAVTAFRDVISLSVVPYARSARLRFDKAHDLAFTNTFQFYPWMLDKNYEDMILTNPANLHVHLLSEFHGQSFPEQGHTSIMERDIDLPLAKELLNRWVVRFTAATVEWKDKALFRSLNMANEAGRIPALTAGVFYDAGRQLALWVSAYEIVAHPGGQGQSNFGTVSALLENVKWLNPKLAAVAHTIPNKTPQVKQLATWICRRVYDLRNDFLHGNDVDPDALKLNGKPVTDFAACLFRLLLTGFLDLHFNVRMPPSGNVEEVAAFISHRMAFNKFQRAYEDALLKAI